jgi:replicative DNA helicase
MNDRILPHDLESEKAVLGTILFDGQAIFRVSDLLQPTDFYPQIHREIYTAMLALSAESDPIDYQTVRAELDRNGKLSEAQDRIYLGSLIEGMSRVANVRHYAGTVLERSIERRLIALGNRIQLEAWSGSVKASDVLERAQTELLDLYGRNQRSGLRPMVDIAGDGYRELQSRHETRRHSGLPTGFVDVDAKIGGLRAGNLIILAGRPGAGKTALAMNICSTVASAGKRIAVFSLEMSDIEIYERMVSSVGHIECGHVVGGYLSRAEWNQVCGVSSTISQYPIWVDESGGITMMQIRARAQRQALDKGLDLIVIDYLQLLKGPGKSIYERVTEISRECKILAKDLKIPVMALSQLHRLESEDTEPQLGDLKESGAIEQDADLVMMLWSGGVEGLRKCKVAKQRNGPTGTFDLGWNAAQVRFYDCARASEQGLYPLVEEGSR